MEYEYDAKGRKLMAVHMSMVMRDIFPGFEKSFNAKEELVSTLYGMRDMPSIGSSHRDSIFVPEKQFVEGYTQYEHCDNFIYENEKLSQVLVDGGYISFSNTAAPIYHFYIKDHLGSNRVVADADGNAEQVNHYYPYGGLMADISTGQDVQRFRFQGKELDRFENIDWNDHGARHADLQTGRWFSVDPLCEKYYNVSPYAYCMNNPVMLVDPDGCDVYYSNTGEFLYRDDKKTDNIIIRNQFLYDLKSMTGAEWINPDMNIIDSSLSAESYSKIFTDILDKNGFDTNMLKNGQVSIVKLKYNSKGDGPQYDTDGLFNHDVNIPYKNAPIAQTQNINGKYGITAFIHPMGDSNRDYLSTESNVVSILGVHEFEGHGRLNIRGKQHWIILKNQRKHSSWKKVSPKLKALYRFFETNKIDNYNKPI